MLEPRGAEEKPSLRRVAAAGRVEHDRLVAPKPGVSQCGYRHVLGAGNMSRGVLAVRAQIDDPEPRMAIVDPRGELCRRNVIVLQVHVARQGIEVDRGRASDDGGRESENDREAEEHAGHGWRSSVRETPNTASASSTTRQTTTPYGTPSADGNVCGPSVAASYTG